jgi:TolB-like protein/DNA-binding winged helix-turn-helix (wHTH) protein
MIALRFVWGGAVAGNFRLGPWLVEPSLSSISRSHLSIHLTPKVMSVLVCLVEHAGDTVNKEVLYETVWPDTFVGDDVLKGYISDLRRVLEDDAREPKIIQTIPKSGYRLVAQVEWIKGTESSTHGLEKGDAPARNHRKLRMAALAVIFTSVPFVVVLSNVGRVRSWLISSATTPQIQSLAVLPLRSLSSDPNQEYFSDGLTDALITDLAQIGSIKVISHTSTMQYKNTKKPLPEIARELNVDGIVEGTVQRSGDHVRITAQLLYGPSDKHLWANSYEGDFSNIFTMERNVSEDVARQVRAQLTAAEQRQLAQPRPVDPKVLEAYLQGNFHLNRYGEGSGQYELKKAAEYFQQAIGADPNFAPAYGGLANAHVNLLLASAEDVALAKRTAEKAIELDPNYAGARNTLGLVKWQGYLDWRGAEKELRQAITVSPNNAGAHHLLSLLLIVTGQSNEGLRECKIAQQLDPNNDHSSMCLFHSRNYDASIAILRMLLQKDPNNGLFHLYLFLNYTEENMEMQSIDELTRSLSLFGFSQAAGNVKRAFAVGGYKGAIRQWTKELEQMQATKQAYLPGNLTRAYAILGDKDRAFYWLEHAYQHQETALLDSGVAYLSTDPGFDPLRSDPRFKDLLRRIGL